MNYSLKDAFKALDEIVDIPVETSIVAKKVIKESFEGGVDVKSFTVELPEFDIDSEKANKIDEIAAKYGCESYMDETLTFIISGYEDDVNKCLEDIKRELPDCNVGEVEEGHFRIYNDDDYILDDRQPIKESAEFNLNDSTDIDNAINYVKEDSKKEPEEVVVDIDADTIDKVAKDNVGSFVFTCTNCGTEILRTLDELKEIGYERQEDGTFKLNNPDKPEEFITCPECHNSQTFNGNKRIEAVDVDSEVKGESSESGNIEPETENEPVEEEPKEEDIPLESGDVVIGESLKEDLESGQLNESSYAYYGERIPVHTGLKGKKDYDILSSVIGQLSDGAWENSRQAERYWKNMDVDMKGDDVIINAAEHLFDGKGIGFDTNVNRYFAKKLKQIVKLAKESHPEIEWDRNCDYKFDGYFHGHPTVQEIYRVYDKLLGRKDHFTFDKDEVIGEGYIKHCDNGWFSSIDGQEWDECSEEEYLELKDGGYEEVDCEEQIDDIPDEEIDEELNSLTDEDKERARSIIADQIRGEWDAEKNYTKAVADLKELGVDTENAQETMLDIAGEEQTHVGELQKSLEELDNKVLDNIKDGEEEFIENTESGELEEGIFDRGINLDKNSRPEPKTKIGKFVRNIADKFEPRRVIDEFKKCQNINEVNNLCKELTDKYNKRYGIEFYAMTLPDNKTVRIIKNGENIYEFVPGEIKEEYEEFKVEDINEDLFDKHINKYLSKVYENFDSYKTTSGYIKDLENKIVLEGQITFKDNKTQATTFVLEGVEINDNKVKFSGLNEDFGEYKSFTVIMTLDNKNLITESLSYSYKCDNELVEGLVKREEVEDDTIGE